MIRFAIFSLVLCAVSFVTDAQYTKAKNCSVDVFDASFAKAYGHFGLDYLGLPETQAKLKEYCRNITNNKVLSKDFGERCLTGTSQTLLNLQVYNVDRVNKPYCAKNGKKREAFVRWSKCGNAAKPETKKCWDKMNEGMNLARKVANNKSRIPIVCCKYYAWIKCNSNAWKKTADCDQESIEGYEQLIHKATVDSMNLICNRYEDDDAKCSKLFEEIPKKKAKDLRPTPITYIFDIFESL
uniref:Uncharacterized protein LOC113790842 n=1 Tax=Dermatophagoides pteronyssinus TaxID=6956 RepID=A0A6P6XU42_DERPT|nr:uncharacterized protein LOC113790842 [Dermatophagoides pteronyssinus]